MSSFWRICPYTKRYKQKSKSHIMHPYDVWLCTDPDINWPKGQMLQTAASMMSGSCLPSALTALLVTTHCCRPDPSNDCNSFHTYLYFLAVVKPLVSRSEDEQCMSTKYKIGYNSKVKGDFAKYHSLFREMRTLR